MDESSKGVVKCPRFKENMLNKINPIYILLLIFCMSFSAHAENPSPVFDSNNTVSDSDRAKEKAFWLSQTVEKEKQHKQNIENQANEIYDQAVDLYRRREFADAKKKFEELDLVIPGFKSTARYVSRINREEEILLKKQEAQQQLEAEAKERQHLEDLKEQAEFLYSGAVSLFKQKNIDGALAQFNQLEKIFPNFRSTRIYIARIEQLNLDQEKFQMDSQVDPVYVAAVNHYNNNDFETAKAEFLKVTEKVFDYKSSQYYLSKIDVKIREAQEEKSRQQELAMEAKRQEELKERTEQATKMYDEALTLFLDKKWEASRTQFEAVEQLMPNFKNTDRYLQKIEDEQTEAAKNNSTSVSSGGAIIVQPVIPAQVNVVMSLEDQQKQAQDIADLAQKSAELYHQIADIADDSSTVQTKRKMAQVDGLLNNLKENKERLLHQMQREEWRRQQREERIKQDKRRAEAEATYQVALDCMRSHEFSKAKIQFSEVENIYPDYKNTRQYLKNVDDDIKRAGLEAVTAHEQAEAEHLKILQDKENDIEATRVEQEKEKEHLLQQQQQEELQALAQKASDINDEIIHLSKIQDYIAMKVKFTDLENTVAALTKLKDTMAAGKGISQREKELAREGAIHQKEMISAQRHEDQQMHAYDNMSSSKEIRPVLSVQTSDIDQYKSREIMQEQNTLFSEGVDRYEHKKYTQAKLLFGELADQHDRRAQPWLTKVDRAITEELLRSQVGEERERTAFLADQLNAQRQLSIIQGRERLRQKKLTEELERQVRLYEDDRLLQLRKEEALKVQDRERRSQEEKRLLLEKEAQKQQVIFHFHKIKFFQQPKVVNNLPVHSVAATLPPVSSAPALVTPAQQALLDQQAKIKADEEATRQAKIKADEEVKEQAKFKVDQDARQKLQEDKNKEKEYKMQLRAQREQARQAKIKAEAETRQKLIEERENARQKERERRKEIRAQYEQERQARKKAEAEARERIKEELKKEKEHQQVLKEEEARAEAERQVQEEKQKEEVLHQQELDREEKVKQDEIIREETQRREEIEEQERQQQDQLTTQRESIRQQLESGVEGMYQDAMALYKQGDFKDAAERFKDVQDILPGYKRCEQYLYQAQQRFSSKGLDLFKS